MRMVRTRQHTIPEVIEGIDNPETISNGNKFLQNGMLFIRCDGRTYNMLGQIVNQ